MNKSNSQVLTVKSHEFLGLKFILPTIDIDMQEKSNLKISNLDKNRLLSSINHRLVSDFYFDLLTQKTKR